MRYLLILLIFSAGFWACQPDEACVSSATSRMVLDFYVQTDTTPARDTLIFSQIRSLTAKKPFVTKDSLLTRVVLRLDPDRDSTVFVFDRPNLLSDSLVLRYQRRYRLIAPDCYLEVSFQNLQVLRSTFTDVRVINTELVEPSNDMDVQVIRPR